jgi:hypothetical protein
MKTILKKLSMNINVLVFLPAYIIFILTVAFTEKEDKSATIIKTHKYSVSQPMQKIKSLWKIITTAKQ